MNKTLRFYDLNAREMTGRYEQLDYVDPVDVLTSYLSPGSKVLEIGTGSGRDASRLLECGFDVCGIDGSKGMIGEAVELHAKLKGRLILHELPGPLPFGKASFDAVMSWAALMHLPRENLVSVFTDISRVTAASGIFAYSVNTARSGLDSDNRDERGRRFTCLSSAEWERLHTTAGFDTLTIHETDDVTGRDGIRWVTIYARKRSE